MTTLLCLVADLDDLPADPEWLSAGERDTAHSLKIEKRRRDWLLGRYTAKRALTTSDDECDGGLARWEILADRDGAPRVWKDGRPASVEISLSHSGGRALCVVAPPGTAPGCDLERIETRSPSFVDTFFTARECAQVAEIPEAERALLVTLIWSAKESALKVLRHGLRKDTRSVQVQAQPGDGAECWQPLVVNYADSSRPMHGWWQTDAGFVLTVAADRHTHAPRWLDDGPGRSQG